MNHDALRESLKAAGLGDMQIEQIVKSATEPKVDLAAVEAVAEEMLSKSGSNMLPDFASGYDFDDDDDDEVYDVGLTLERFAKAADAMVARQDAVIEHVTAHNEVLQKGWLALGKVVQQLTEVVEDQDAKIEHLTKSLGIVQPPRALTGAAPLPTPGEQLQKGEGASSRDEVLSKAHAILSDPETPQRRKQEMLSAVSLLDTGIDPMRVVQQYSIH